MKCMGNVSNTIWETCKTYLFQQGKFLAILWVLIAACIFFYFKVLEDKTLRRRGGHPARLHPRHPRLLRRRLVRHPHQHRRPIPAPSFSALKGNPFATLGIPLRSGMSVGLLLVCVELFFMICILVFLKELAGPCFIGFAIGESLGACALRICGGIFTKIADIGSDLMKIVFKLPEDDPKNPGVIADCTGDNAGDSVGPTADGFRDLRRDRRGADRVPGAGAGSQPGHLRHAHHLAVRHARADDCDLAGLLLPERGHQPGQVRRQEGFRFRSAADPPGVDHLGGVHPRSRLPPAICCWATSRARHRFQPVSGGCSRPSSPAAPWPAR